MANSDNVLRAGLTDKHIDIEELMRHIKFEPTHPFILQPSSDTQSAFTPPVEEFELYQYNLTRQEVLESKSAEIWIVTKGQVEANDHLFDEGGAFFVLPQQKLRMIPNGEAILFRACVPNSGKN